ncbi:ArnT family glycosyltransferase, partial [Patescibacteria group bacterium]
MPFLKENKKIVIIFLLALAIRILFFSISFYNNGGDLIDTIHGYDGYFEIANNLVDNGVFSVSSEEPFAPHPLRPPVYPYYLAGIMFIFGSYWAVVVANLLLGSLIPVLGFLLIRKVMSGKIAFGTGLLMALEPFSIILSFIFYTETVFIFLFLSFLNFFFRYFEDPSFRNIVWSAVFLGLATLVKPTTQYLPIVIPLLILLYFRKSLNRKI